MRKLDALNLIQIMQKFPDVDSARAYLEKQRWPEGPICPHCSVCEVYKLTPKPDSKRPCRKGLYKCKGCRKQFTVTVGTIFEDSHIPLNLWLVAIFLLCSSKKGISAHQIHRMLHLSYKAAWFMMHRIRYAMAQPPMREKLYGVIEADETYIGGKVRGRRGRPAVGGPKVPVFALVQRGGQVRSFPMLRVTHENLRDVLKDNVSPDSALITDEYSAYRSMSDHFASHETVNHHLGEYVKPGGVTTNTVEGFFGILKRGINGTYHFVSKRHLHRYLAEFDFRYNTRSPADTLGADGARTEMALAGFEGKRLKYKD